MKSIAIIGIGTGGLQTLCHLCTWLGNDWKIVSIHNPSIPIIKIGESTFPTFVQALQMGVDYNPYDHLDELGSTLKIGTVFKKWRPHDFINPLVEAAYALHIDSYKLAKFVLPRLKNRWGNKIELIEQQVDNLEELEYDYIVDCRGFPKDYSNYIKPKEMLINHALVHNIKKPGDWNYTGHRATKNGWMFEIPLMERQSYGYMYCDSITSKEEALNDFAEEINVPINELNDIEYSFTPYYAKKILEGRIFKNGNRALFFEPLSANSLFAYGFINKLIISLLELKEINDERFNIRSNSQIESIRDLIYFYYQGGSTYNTPFWIKMARLASKGLNKSKSFAKLRNDFKHYNKLGTPYLTPAWALEPQSLKIVDEQMGYNYFKDKEKDV